MEFISTISELDKKLLDCEVAATRSDADLREEFAKFSMRPIQFTGDPFCAEYRCAQMDLYEKISGRSYRLENEVMPFDVDSMVRDPFPYCTKSPQVVGVQFIAIGSLISHLNIPPGGGEFWSLGQGGVIRQLQWRWEERTLRP